MAGPPRRGGRSSSTLALFLGLLLAGLGATSLAVREATATSRERDDRLVELLRSEVSARLEGSVSSLRGSASMAVDGEVSLQEFVAVADEVVPASVYSALAFSEVVTDDDVTRWQTSTGIEIKDTDGAGGFVATASRPMHIVVRYVYPETGSSAALIGFDLASDPVRARGAMRSIETGSPAFIGPINLADSGAPGLFVIQAVRDPNGDPVGFVSSGVDVGPTIDAAGSLPHTSGVGLAVDGVALAGEPGRGSSRSFDAGGLEFMVWADDGRPTDWTLAIVLGLGTLLLAGTAQVVRRSERAYHRRQAELLRRQTSVAELGQLLAAAADSATVIRIATGSIRSIVDASRADVAVVDDSDHTKLVAHHDGSVSDQRVVRRVTYGVLDPLPLSRSVRRNEVVVLPDRAACSDRFPDALADLERAGIHAVLAVPLRFSGGGAVGALGLAWDRPRTTAELDDDTTVATTIAELVARALERAIIAEVLRDRAAQLSNLSQDLATAQLPAEVFDAIETWVPPIVGATHAVIRTAADGLDADGMDDASRSLDLDLGVSINRRPQQLHVVWPQTVDRSPTVGSVLHTVARLAEAALGRTEVHQHEHELVEQLQVALLGHDEPGRELEIAVRYEPAVSLLGMGGDFYDTIRVERSDFLVVGDVTGHGPSAVASMAELKTLTRHLLTSGAGLVEVCAQLDQLLLRRGSFATMSLVEVDHVTRTFHHLSAGHPYPLVRTDGRWSAVTDGRRPLLGVDPVQAVVPGELRFADDDAVVLFTDGLVEDRRTSLPESIDQMRQIIDSLPTSTADDLADRILTRQTTDRGPSRTDDDIAVLVAVVRRAERDA